MANLTEKMGNIWKEAKKQPKDLWFFYLFLLTFTLGVRKVILYFPIKGAFNEYTGAYVYASDIFLCLTILVWIISILYNKIVNMSMNSDGASGLIHRMDHTESVDNSFPNKLSTGKFAYFKALFTKMFHVEHFMEKNNANCSTWNNFFSLGIFTIPLILVAWSFSSVCWSENQIVGFYRSVRFLELYVLFIYVSLRFVPYLKQCSYDCSTWNNLQSENVGNVPRGTFPAGCGKMFHVEHFYYILSKMTQYFRAILLGFIAIMLFDHYLWDIWQGQVLFWSVCGILAGISFSGRINLKNCSTWNNFNKDSSEIVPRGTFHVVRVFFGIIMLLGVTQSLIGITQFVVQRSCGLFWFKESLISPDIAGVAKIIVNHQAIIRAYGLFPHPNILGGFLFFSIITTLFYKKMFHVEHSERDNLVNCSTWNNSRPSGEFNKNVPRGTFWSSLKEKVLNMGNIINLILLIQIFGILLSFSKSAILALAIALVYINVPPQKIQNCSTWNNFELRGRRGTSKFDDLDSKKSGAGDFTNCSTWNNLGRKILRMFHVEHFRVGMKKFALSAGFLLLVVVSLAYFKFDFQANFVKSLGERSLYLTISERIISENSIVGVGTGQFIFQSERLFPNLEIWQYQPVHNVFLLIWSEWGIIGLVFFIVFLWKLLHINVPRGTIE